MEGDPIKGGTTFRWVHMKKFWSMWTLSSTWIKELTWNLGPSVSLLVLITTFQQNYHNTQLMVTPNEMVGLNCRDSLRCRRLEVAGERENGHARGRHAKGWGFLSPRVSPSRTPVFSCAHYFQAPATQAIAVITHRTTRRHFCLVCS